MSDEDPFSSNYAVSTAEAYLSIMNASFLN